MKAYVINPLKRTVEQVDFSGHLEDLDQLLTENFGYNAEASDILEMNKQGDFCVHINIRLMNFLAQLDTESVEKEYGVFGYACACGKFHSIFGRAVIFGRDKEKKLELANPSFSLEALREKIKWGNIVQLTREEASQVMEGKTPDRFLPVEPIRDAKSAVTVAMELGRIGSKVH